MVVNGLLVHKAKKIIIQQNGEELFILCIMKESTSFWPGWTAKRELLDRYDSKEFTN